MTKFKEEITEIQEQCRPAFRNLRCYWYGDCTNESSTDEEKKTSVFESFDLDKNGKVNKQSELLKCLPHMNIQESLLKKAMEKLDSMPEEIEQPMFEEGITKFKEEITELNHNNNASNKMFIDNFMKKGMENMKWNGAVEK